MPEHDKITAQKWRKFRWLLIGLLSPKMMIFTALEQPRAALHLTRETQAQLAEKAKPKWPKLRRWLRLPKQTLARSEEVGKADHELYSTGRRHP